MVILPKDSGMNKLNGNIMLFSLKFFKKYINSSGATTKKDRYEISFPYLKLNIALAKKNRINKTILNRINFKLIVLL